MPKRFKYTRNPLIDSEPATDFRSMLQRTAEREPEDKKVYVYARHRVDHAITYRDFYRNIRSFGSALHKKGLTGKRVCVIGDCDPAYMTTYYGTVITGGVIVPLDKDISDEEVEGFLRLAEVCAVVYTEGQNGRMLALSERMPDVLFLSVHPGDAEKASSRIGLYDEFLAEGAEAYEGGDGYFDTVPQDLKKCCAIIFTSGTTGSSKGVMLSQGNLVASLMASADVIDQLGDFTTVLSVLPMHHTYEVTTGHLTAHYYGATIAINESLKYVSKNILKYKPDYMILVPMFVETMHKKMWDEIRKKGKEKKVRRGMKMSEFLMKFGIDLRQKMFAEILESYGGNLRAIVCGGAKLDPQCIRDFRAVGIEVQEGYGITECAPLLAANPINRNRVGSAGLPVRGVSARIEKEKESDKTGEILCKGPNVMLGYYKNEDATRAVFTDDGWFRTGDLGYIDRGGYIHITGRKKNVIVLSNGKNVFPEELEEHLRHCPLFAESAVVGRKKENGEEVITAVIYPDYDALKGLGKEEIEERVRAELNEINRTLPQYKQMRGLEIRQTEFEKTTSRKIKRHKI